jgi:hypothetical protein
MVVHWRNRSTVEGSILWTVLCLLLLQVWRSRAEFLVINVMWTITNIIEMARYRSIIHRHENDRQATTNNWKRLHVKWYVRVIYAVERKKLVDGKSPLHWSSQFCCRKWCFSVTILFDVEVVLRWLRLGAQYKNTKHNEYDRDYERWIQIIGKLEGKFARRCTLQKCQRLKECLDDAALKTKQLVVWLMLCLK